VRFFSNSAFAKYCYSENHIFLAVLGRRGLETRVESSSKCAARHAASSERKPRDGKREQARSGQRRHRRLAQIIFGFWFRTRACGSGCRLLPKQRQTRPNNVASISASKDKAQASFAHRARRHHHLLVFVLGLLQYVLNLFPSPEPLGMFSELSS
jgi:hypothetical protein